MATIVRRSAENGDTRLRRVPFVEPGPTPLRRASALSFQGGNGDAVTALKDAEGGRDFAPSAGDPSTYRVQADGVPAFRFDCTESSAPTPKRPTLYADPGAGSPVVRSMLVVARIRRGATPASGADSFTHLVRAVTAGGVSSLSVAGPATANANRVALYGGPGSTPLYGPVWPADGQLRVCVAVFDGTTGRIYLDGVAASGPINAVIDYRFFAGYIYSGADYDIVEAAQYDVVLTPAQVAEKRAHYRALYQF